MSRRALTCLTALLILAALPSFAQQVSGRLFEDRDGDGIRDAGEPPIPSAAVQLLGDGSGSGVADLNTLSAPDGLYSFSPGDGCYLVAPVDPPGWRLSMTRADGFAESTPGYLFPIGQPRFAKLDQGIANLKSGSYRYTALGDSIAWNFNICGYPSSFWYSQQIRSRLACSAPAATVSLDQGAVKGEHTDDLLVEDLTEFNNVFRVMQVQPDLISLSMIGNDLLNVDPGGGGSQAQIDRAVLEVLDARQNLQEALSVMVSEVPNADIVLNTLYDNEAYNCNPGNFHRTWVPIVDRILRDLAWGQTRRVSIAEAAAEFAQGDQLGGCTGFDAMICRDLFQFDTIHPTNDGFTVIREKVWEAAGGVNLGSGDPLNRSSIDTIDFGYLRRVRRLLPSRTTVWNGAAAIDPANALDDSDAQAAARITLGSGDEEFLLDGFPDWFDEIQIVRIIAGVRYRTNGSVNDDFYRMEASPSGQFRPPPGFAYTPTHWNFYTPIVGGGGPNQPAVNADYPNAVVLAVPDVAAYREASATLTQDPILPAGAAHYEWPPITHAQLADTAIRVVSAPVAGTAGNDPYEIELDAAWLDLYGWEKARPVEVAQAEAARQPDGTLEVSFEPVAGAQRYNLYFGRLSSARAGSYDHGGSAPASAICDATTQPAPGSRLKIVVAPQDQPAVDGYWLITAHVDEVESPAGYPTSGVEIDRSQSICR